MTGANKAKGDSASLGKAQATADPAGLMSEIRVRLSGEPTDARPSDAAGLEGAGQPAPDGLHETLGLANERYADARRTAHAPAPPVPEELEILGRAPGYSRGWLSPKRWYCAIHRLLLGRQEKFNEAVARWLGMVPQQDAALLGTIDSLGHLVASVNLLARRFDGLQDLPGDLRNVQARLEVLSAEGAASARELSQAVRAVEAGWEERARELAARLDAEMQWSRELADRLDSEAQWSRELADRLDSEAQWSRELADRLDGEARKFAARRDEVDDALAARLRLTEQAMLEIRQAATALTDRVERLLHTPCRTVPPVAGTLPGGIEAPDFDFLAFEGATRGTEERIAGEQRKYLRWFAGADGVLDAGCGRGEFLEILRDAGVTARGIDMDPRMVAHCREKGLEAEEASLFEHLAALPDASLGGLFLGQVVEHLDRDALMALPALALRKLRPGAWFVAETINPMCLTTFSGAFYADPTHVRPVHPEAMKFLLGAAGFEEIGMELSAPVPREHSLALLREAEQLPPPVKEVLLQANANFARLNSVLYGHGNYAMAGRRPAAGG